MNEQQIYQYRVLNAKLKKISLELSKLEDSLTYLKDSLNENFIINHSGFCVDRLSDPISNIEYIKKDLDYKVLPYIQDRIN